MSLKKPVSILLALVFLLTLLPIHALALGGDILVTLKSGLDGVEDVCLASYTYGSMVYSEEDFVNGTFMQFMNGNVLYTRYKVSDAPESFGRTDLLCWTFTNERQGRHDFVRPGDIYIDAGSGDELTLEAIWAGLEQNSYAFSSPQSVTVTENTVITSIPFTLSELTLGSAAGLCLQLHSGDFTDGENTIHYEAGTTASFTEAGQTRNCTIRISADEWAEAAAGRYTATLEYDAIFQIGLSGYPLRTVHGSLPMTLQVGHDVTVTSNNSDLGTAGASAAMARQGETVTLIAAPESEYGLRSWSVQSGGVTVNADDTFVMGNEDVSIRAVFDPLRRARFRNYNGMILFEDYVFSGETPSYSGVTPAKPSEERYDYFFSGWDPPLGPISIPTVYYAQYRSEYKYFVTFNAGGGSGTMDRDTYYASDGTYTLPACGFAAPQGHVFWNWTFVDGGTAYMAGSTVTGLTGDISVSANWIELTLQASPTDAGSVAYAGGAFTATANEGYTFDHWEYADDEYSPAPVGTVWPTDNPYRPAAVDHKIYTAVFTGNPYNLAVLSNNSERGAVSYRGTPKTGNTITLTATANQGYLFKEWVTDPEGIAINANNKFRMPAGDVTVTAIFVSEDGETYAATVTGGTGSGEYAEGEAVAITANAPEAGLRFREWTGAGGLTFVQGSTATPNATFLMPGEAVTVAAAYEAIPRFPLTGENVLFFDEAYNVLTEAEEGQQVIVSADPETFPEGMYFTGEYASEDVSIPVDDFGGGSFIMPGKAVAVSAVLAGQETLRIKLTGNTIRVLPEPNLVGQLSGTDAFFYDETLEAGVLDLNGDGAADVRLYYENNAVQRLPGADAITGGATLPLENPVPLRYSAVVFVLSKPADVETITATAQPGKIVVTWSAVAGAKNYHLARQRPGTGWSRLSSEVFGTSFEDDTAVAGTTYRYRVRAQNEVGNGSYTMSDFVTAPAPKPGEIASVTAAAETGKITVSWPAADNAARYVVAR